MTITYHLPPTIAGEVIAAIIQGTESVLSDLRTNGIDIQSTGGETADVGDLVRTVIVDSTVIARMKRSDVIDNANIAGEMWERNNESFKSTNVIIISSPTSLISALISSLSPP